MSTIKKFYSTLSFLILIAVIYGSFAYLMPSATTSVKLNGIDYKLSNALNDVKNMSQKPHFVGAQAHQSVRDYIVKQLQNLGLEVQIQQQLGVNRKWHSAAITQNILARIKGTTNQKALLLLSHYDSNPHSSLGASDDGNGVATILESLRVFLASNPHPKNDIIILISDAEEIGLNGADAFVNHHPWAKDVGLVLNFEARGSGGPSYMLLETNGGNTKLIKAFLKAHPKYPVANSLMYSIYKMLPNDTDLTVFRQDGNINGFNFAFIGDHFDYHTAQDSYQRLDHNTLMHQATYLLPLLNYFSDADLSSLNSTNDLVYFSFPFFKMITFPFSWVTALTVLAWFLFLIICVLGLMRGRLTLKGIAKGFMPLLISLIISAAVAIFGWKLLLVIYPQYRDILHGFTYNGYTYIAAFCALTFTITYWFYNRFKKSNTFLDFSIAPIFLWLIINVLISIYLKGSGFFIIPVYFAISGLAVEIIAKSKTKNRILMHTIFAMPLLLIFSPLVKMFPVGLGLKDLFISSIFVVLMMGLLVPILLQFKTRKLLAPIGFALSIMFFVTAGFTSNFSVDRKKPNSILYVYDADAQQAYWTTYNYNLDVFTKQFLGDHPEKGGIDNKTTASKYNTGLKWHTKAKLIDLKMPLITKIKDSLPSQGNTYHYSITPQRAANRMELLANGNLHFLSFSVNGQPFEKNPNNKYVMTTETRKEVLTYFFTKPNETVTIDFTLEPGEKPDFTLYEASYDLFKNPNFNITPRTDIMMPMPFVLNDAIVVKKHL